VKKVRIGRNYVANLDSLASILLGDKMERVVRAAGEQVAERARAMAPVDTGAFRDAIGVIVDRHPDRVVAHIGSKTRKAILVEERTSVMRRALG
jgi:hypothetical protein